MNKPFKLIPLDAAGAGMELACDLHDAHGTILLQQGSVLSDSLLAALARRGVAQLRVLGEPEDEAGESVAAARQQERLDHLFRRAEGAAAAQLLASLRAYRMELPR